MMHHRDWTFTGRFDDLENPPRLLFFLNELLFVLKEHTPSDRQMQHQPKKNNGFRQAVRTPLWIGLPLAIHSRVRDKTMSIPFRRFTLGVITSRYLTWKSWLRCAPADEGDGWVLFARFPKESGERLVHSWHIALLKDTPTAHKKFHGTVIVVNQRSAVKEAINQPLVIPENLLSGTSHDWSQVPGRASNQTQTGKEKKSDFQKLVEKLAKEETIPIWAATKLLLLSHSYQSYIKTNSDVAALLFKISPTDYATLYTILMLTQGIAENFHNVWSEYLQSCPTDSGING